MKGERKKQESNAENYSTFAVLQLLYNDFSSKLMS